MTSIQPTIPLVPTQRFLFADADPQSAIAVSRRRVIDTMTDAVRALNAGIQRLESTGDFDESDIDRTYDRLVWAVEWFEEERLSVEDQVKHKGNCRHSVIQEVA